MLQQLSERLSRVMKTLSGQSRLTDANMAETLQEVRQALLEADVALPVVKDFITNIQDSARNRKVQESLSPGQALLFVVHQELARLLGAEKVPLNLAVRPPAVILLAGLQGVGKTTTVGKLALHLQKKLKKKTLVASCDVHRPAAMEQLRILSDQVDVAYAPAAPGMKAVDIAQAALDKARKEYFAVLIIDSAGRLALDGEMMDEISDLHQLLKPIETLYVLDAMQGQDAVNTARTFHERLALTGLIITKMDGDARGGAALSVRQVTGCPIKFIGTSEKMTGLEPCDPQGLASRILGMGDMNALVEKMSEVVDVEQMHATNKKIVRGRFDMNMFREHMAQMRKMGGLTAIVANLPMQLRTALPNSDLDESQFGRMEAIIGSMTRAERDNPDLIKSSRKQRIAKGSGTTVQDVNGLLQRFGSVQQLMKRFGKNNSNRGLMNALGAMTKMRRGPDFS